MFPVALDTATDSKNETRITLIAQNIFSDLRFSKATNALVIFKQPSSAADYSNPVYAGYSALTNFTSRYVAYDSEGRALQSISPGDFSGQFTNTQAAFMASIATNIPPQTGLVRVDVTIVSPPQAGSGSAARKTNTFTTYLPTQ